MVIQRLTIVLWLCKHPNTKSARCTSHCGVNNFLKFEVKYSGGNLNPIPHKSLSFWKDYSVFLLVLFLLTQRPAIHNNPELHSLHPFTIGLGCTHLPFDLAGLARVFKRYFIRKTIKHWQQKSISFTPFQFANLFLSTINYRSAPFKSRCYFRIF